MNLVGPGPGTGRFPWSLSCPSDRWIQLQQGSEPELSLPQLMHSHCDCVVPSWRGPWFPLHVWVIEPPHDVVKIHYKRNKKACSKMTWNTMQAKTAGTLAFVDDPHQPCSNYGRCRCQKKQCNSLSMDKLWVYTKIGWVIWTFTRVQSWNDSQLSECFHKQDYILYEL